MLYTVLVGSFAPNGVININTFTQQIYLGISGRHNVKIKGMQLDVNPDLQGLVLIRIDEFYNRLSPNTVGSYNFALLTDGFTNPPPIDLDLGIQNLNNYLTFTITHTNTTLTALNPITQLNFLLYLEIEEETKYLLK